MTGDQIKCTCKSLYGIQGLHGAYCCRGTNPHEHPCTCYSNTYYCRYNDHPCTCSINPVLCKGNSLVIHPCTCTTSQIICRNNSGKHVCTCHMLSIFCNKFECVHKRNVGPKK